MVDPQGPASWEQHAMTNAIAILLCGIIIVPPAEETERSAHVRTAAGRLHEGTILSWSPGKRLRLKTRNKTIVEISSRDVDRITFSPQLVKPPCGTWLIVARNNSRLFGDIVGGDDTKLTVRHALLGQFSLPLDQLVSIRRMRRKAGDPHPPRAGEEQTDRDADSVLMANRDLMSGVVTAVRADGISILSNDNEQTLSWAVVDEIHFAAPAGPVHRLTGVRLRFADGSALLAKALDWQDGSIKADLDGRSVIQFDPAILNQAEVINGRRVWLTDLVPAEYRSIPFFDRPWPLRLNADALGGPLRLVGTKYQLGIGLHAASRVKWKLDDQYERFTGLIGIDDSAGRWADADVTIFADQKPVARLNGLQHKQQPRKIDVDLRGASELVIEIGFGRNGDVQDRIDLVNPALIRRAPSPATGPTAHPQ